MNILFLTDLFFPDVGGIETLSDCLASAFAKAGHAVHLLTHSKDPSDKQFSFLVIRKPDVMTLLKEHAWADVVFENNPCMQFSAIGVLFGKPSVIGIQTWITREDGSLGWQDKLKYRWLKRADQVIACSEAVRINSFKNAVVIGNAYQDNIFKIMPEVRRDKALLFVGRLVSDKGADLAIEAFSKLCEREEFEDLYMTIVGDGPERQPLEDLVLQSAMQDKITFTGAMRDEALARCFNQHKILLVPSRWKEPFGIVALEGTACGCIPIVADGGGLPDAVGNAGLVFERGDVSSLTTAIIRLMNDHSLQQKLADDAGLHLAAHTAEAISKAYLAVIENVTSRNNKSDGR